MTKASKKTDELNLKKQNKTKFLFESTQFSLFSADENVQDIFLYGFKILGILPEKDVCWTN